MNDLSMRILAAVKGDHAAIRSLATAIAHNDGDAVRGLLSARGLELPDEALRDVMSRAQSSDEGVACTFTCTCTCT